MRARTGIRAMSSARSRNAECHLPARNSTATRTGLPGRRPGEKHQVRRFFCVFEKRLARRAHSRAHCQPIDEVHDLGRPLGHWKDRWDLSCADAVPESTLHHRYGSSRHVRYELPDLCDVDERRDRYEETTGRAALLRRSLYGVLQEASDRGTKRLRREKCLRRESALLLCIRQKAAQEERSLVSEDGVQARPTNAHAVDEIVDRHSVVTLRPEDLGRLIQCFQLVEVAWSSTRPRGFCNHLVRHSLRRFVPQQY